MKVVRKVTKHKTDIIKIRMEHQNFGLLIGIGGSFSSEAAPTVFPNPATHQPPAFPFPDVNKSFTSVNTPIVCHTHI